MQPDVFERKYEIDSFCYPIRLAYEYWKVTGDDSIFGDVWMKAVENILKTFHEQQRKVTAKAYHFTRVSDRAFDTIGWDGFGAPVKPVGLIASMFRPSDDATILPFLIPSNFMAVSSMNKAAEILKHVAEKDAAKKEAALKIAKDCSSLADEVQGALQKYAIYNHPKYGKIYAYEVDGFGNQLLMDDSNVPSLLSIRTPAVLFGARTILVSSVARLARASVVLTSDTTCHGLCLS